MKEIKILLVEDDEDDYLIFKDYLNDIKIRKYSLTWVNNYQEALSLIRKKEHDIFFFDYLLGGRNGLDLIRQCTDIGINIPIILLTGLGNHETDLAAMELGAMDYLIKGDINATILERSIRYSIEQKRSLKKIRDSEEKYRSIFEDSHDVIFLADSSGKIYEVNHAAERVFRYTRDEMLQLNAIDLYDSKIDCEKFLDAISQTGSYSNFEVILKDKYGNKKYCSLTATVQKVDDRGVIYYQEIVHDVTRRKKIERDLQIAEKLAVTGRVARTIAHEVRNPLTNINLSIEHLEDGIKEPDFKPYFEIIKRNSHRINNLVTGLMESSQPAELTSALVSIHSMLNKTVLLATDRAALKNIRLETEFTGNNAVLECDEPKLTMAILNIIINAIESVNQNTGVIKITAHCLDNKCIIVIEDNGSGIQKEDLPRIFEPYFSNKINGMGLGLVTAHNIIHTHKGNIDVESELGSGTRFIINLKI